mmetsp:Transcript_14796/g.30111  ORF Transcript_14796/g.30111 Transcript_14796/m.30111 type:complete len:215 (+) Transcript_14796:1704-2348(+)
MAGHIGWDKVLVDGVLCPAPRRSDAGCGSISLRFDDFPCLRHMVSLLEGTPRGPERALRKGRYVWVCDDVSLVLGRRLWCGCPHSSGESEKATILFIFTDLAKPPQVSSSVNAIDHANRTRHSRWSRTHGRPSDPIRSVWIPYGGMVPSELLLVLAPGTQFHYGPSILLVIVRPVNFMLTRIKNVSPIHRLLHIGHVGTQFLKNVCQALHERDI